MNTFNLITKTRNFSILLLVSIVLINPVLSAEKRGLSRQTSLSSKAITTPFSNGQYRAIVIGNNQYTDPKNVWVPLKTAVADAESVARILTSDYGFSDVILMRNATRRQILLAVNSLRRRVKKDDSVLMYYAGHGYMDKSTDEAYWIPVDAEGWDDSFFLSNARIKEKIATIASKVKHTLIVSDSCFSGTLLRGSAAKAAPASPDEPFYRKVSSRRSAQIMAAGGKEFVDDDFKRSGHSPYTYFFVNELKRNDRQYMTTSDLASSLARLVANSVRQTPQFGVLFGAGDEGGEFVFSRTSSLKSLKGKPTVLAMNTTTAKSAFDRLTVELSYWDSIKGMDDPEMYQTYIDSYPRGKFIAIAKRKIQLKVGNESEISQIENLIVKYKSYFSAGDEQSIRRISELQSARKQFIKTFFNQYSNYDINVTGFQYIAGKHQAKVTITLNNLVNKQGRSVTPGAWSRYELQIKKNRKGQWKAFW